MLSQAFTLLNYSASRVQEEVWERLVGQGRLEGEMGGLAGYEKWDQPRDGQNELEVVSGTR